MSCVDQKLSFITDEPYGEGEVRKRFWNPRGSGSETAGAGKQFAEEFIAAMRADITNCLLLPEIVAAMPRPLGPMERAFLMEIARAAGLS